MTWLFILLSILSLTNAQRIGCSSLNVDSTRQFNNCVSRTLGSTGSIASEDQFTACNPLAGNQVDYLECVCNKSAALTSCYNQYCPGDGSAAGQSQNKARYCAAATSAKIVPMSTSYSLPALPTLPSVVTTTAAAHPTVFAVPTSTPRLNAVPSGEPPKWNPAYITVFLLGLVGIWMV